MKKYNYELRRVIREPHFEKWYSFIYENEDELYGDTIVLFFKHTKVLAYLITAYIDMTKNDEYITLIEGLYHDLGISENYVLDFQLDIILLPNEMISNEKDDNQMEEYIDKKISELRKTNKM